MSTSPDFLVQLDTLRWVLRHPLNRGRSWRALSRWLMWHMGTTLRRREREFPYVSGTRLVGGPTLTTANIQHYVGLGELDVMGFLLHYLRPGDLLIDVGANVGAISILAGGLGAHVVAVEPVPDSYQWLLRNVALNKFVDRVECLNVALGERTGSVRMSCSRGAENRVETTELGNTVEVICETLDGVVAARPVSVVKIDVEGFEVPVLRGAASLLSQPSLQAVIVEMKGHGARYGFDEGEIVRTLELRGFECCTYDALRRSLTLVNGQAKRPDNAIFVRDPAAVNMHVAAAPLRPIIWNRSI